MAKKAAPKPLRVDYYVQVPTDLKGTEGHIVGLRKGGLELVIAKTSPDPEQFGNLVDYRENIAGEPELYHLTGSEIKIRLGSPVRIDNVEKTLAGAVSEAWELQDAASRAEKHRARVTMLISIPGVVLVGFASSSLLLNKSVLGPELIAAFALGSGAVIYAGLYAGIRAETAKLEKYNTFAGQLRHGLLAEAARAGAVPLDYAVK